MRNYQIEKGERATRRKAMFFTVLVHLVLLYGLFYYNSEKPSELVPDFVKEWLKQGNEQAVASKKKLP